MLLSVIIPTRNRSQLLSDLLLSLSRQDPVPFQWEVVVVDNGSDDDTSEMVAGLQQTLSMAVRYVKEPKPGLHQGRHRGAKEAMGKFIAFLDDDMVLESTWVQGVEALAKGNAHAVVGRILPQWQDAPPDWLMEMIDGGVMGYLGILDLGLTTQAVEPNYVFGGNSFFPRELIFRLGGFNPDGVPKDLLRFRGDGETALMNKFKQAGLKSIYDPRATAYHVIGHHRMTVDYLCQRAYNQGISDSFSQIRAKHGLDGANTKTIRTLAGKTKSAIRTLFRIFKKEQMSLIQIKLQNAHRAGWKFHQELFASDPEIQEFVLRNNFLE